MPRAVFHSVARYTGPGAVDLADRVESLVVLCDQIRNTGEPVLKEEEVWDAEVEPGLPVWRMLFENEGETLSRDLARSLQIVIDQAASLGEGQLAGVNVQGALGLFANGNATQLNTASDLRTLVRSHMGGEPQDAAVFCADCAIAFPRLKLSNAFPQCISTFDGGYQQYAGVLVRCLEALNDDWTNFERGDLPKTLKAFSARSGFETNMEGNGDRKDELSFAFSVEEGISERVICEPHMKLGSSDIAGDNKYYFHRIYFNPRGHTSFPGLTLIGHAGKHL